MLALPATSEQNPIAHNLLLSIVLKIALILYVLFAPLGKYRPTVILFGLAAGAIGLGSNLSVLVAE